MINEDLDRLPPRVTVLEDGLWRTIHTSNGFRVQLECGRDCGVRIVDRDDAVVWLGSRWHAQALARGLNQAACVKIGNG